MNISGITTAPKYTPTTATGLATGTPAKDTSDSSATGIEGDFLKLAHMTPMQRMRASILKSMNLTEDQLAKYPADERKKVEDEIKEKIKEKIGKNSDPGQLVDLKA